MKNEKLIRATGLIDRLMKILQGFMVAGMIVCAVFLILIPIFGEKLVADSSTVSLGIVTANLAPAALPEFSALRGSLVLMLVTALVNVSVMWFILKEIRGILAPMKEGCPFISGIADKIRRLGWIVLVGGLVTEICTAAENYAEVKAYALERLINPEMVTSVGFNFTLNGTFAVTAILLFVLAHVFRYGEMLQQEADETL